METCQTASKLSTVQSKSKDRDSGADVERPSTDEVIQRAVSRLLHDSRQEVQALTVALLDFCPNQ